MGVRRPSYRNIICKRIGHILFVAGRLRGRRVLRQPYFIFPAIRGVIRHFHSCIKTYAKFLYFPLCLRDISRKSGLAQFHDYVYSYTDRQRPRYLYDININLLFIIRSKFPNSEGY